MRSSTDSSPSTDVVDRDRLYRKVALRLLPLLVICYLVSFIDRTNVGIAQVGLERDLGFSDSIYAFGVSLFFVGFILFEIPSNALMARIGARKTIVRIMFGWGLVTVGTMFVHNTFTFYLARFLLGVAEAGFFPGCLLFLTYWFPSARRTHITATFFMAIPISGVLGSLAAGWIMDTFGGVAGLADWQWLFLLEGLPPLILAGIVAFTLYDGPTQAPWLTPAEKRVIEVDLADEAARKLNAGNSDRHGLRAAVSDYRVWILGLGACAAYTLANAVSFWTPRIIDRAGIDDPMLLGVLSAIPPTAGIVAMQLVGRSSDKHLERRWHTAASWAVAVVAMIGLSLVLDNTFAVVVLLSVMACAHYSGLTVYYSIPSIYLSPRVAATGIAFVTAMGSIAAALAPAMLGAIQAATGDISLGLVASAGIVTCGILVVLLGISAKSLREQAVAQTAPAEAGKSPAPSERTA